MSLKAKSLLVAGLCVNEFVILALIAVDLWIEAKREMKTLNPYIAKEI
jgi:hypothetical protein